MKVKTGAFAITETRDFDVPYIYGISMVPYLHFPGGSGWVERDLDVKHVHADETVQACLARRELQSRLT